MPMLFLSTCNVAPLFCPDSKPMVGCGPYGDYKGTFKSRLQLSDQLLVVGFTACIPLGQQN